MGCFVRGGKNGMGCFVRDDKNCMGCFVRGGKLMRDVLSGVLKMEWDVLSRDVLSYIRVMALNLVMIPIFVNTKRKLSYLTM